MVKRASMEPDMRGNRFENDLIVRIGRIALYKTDIGGLMLKVSGSIGSFLFGLWSLEFDFRGKPTRGLGELVSEFGIGFSIGTDDRFPKCPDFRFLFLKWSWLTRLFRPCPLVSSIPLHLTTRTATVRFMDIDESIEVMVEPELIMDTYDVSTPWSIGATTELFTLNVHVMSKVEVIDRITGEPARLSTLTTPFNLPATKEKIDLVIGNLLTFPSKRVLLKKTSSGMRVEAC